MNKKARRGPSDSSSSTVRDRQAASTSDASLMADDGEDEDVQGAAELLSAFSERSPNGAAIMKNAIKIDGIARLIDEIDPSRKKRLAKEIRDAIGTHGDELVEQIADGIWDWLTTNEVYTEDQSDIVEALRLCEWRNFEDLLQSRAARRLYARAATKILERQMPHRKGVVYKSYDNWDELVANFHAAIFLKSIGSSLSVDELMPRVREFEERKQKPDPSPLDLGFDVHVKRYFSPKDSIEKSNSRQALKRKVKADPSLAKHPDIIRIFGAAKLAELLKDSKA